MKDNHAEIVIERSRQFIINAAELGDLIRALPLSPEQNDALISSIVKQIAEIEETAFRYGFDMGVKAAKQLPEKPGPELRLM